MKDKKELLAVIMTNLAENKIEEADKLLKVFLDYIPEITAEEVTEVAQMLDNKGVFEDASQHVTIEQRVFNIIEQKIPVQDLNSFEEGHPVNTFLKENKIFKELSKRAEELIADKESYAKLRTDWILVAKQFQDINIHYLRKENQLFPFLEKRGFSHPSTIMWSLHDEIRKIAKEFLAMVKEDNEDKSRNLLLELSREVKEMTVKEERVLLPKSVKLLTENDWIEIRKGEEEVGYCLPEKPPMWNPSWKHPSVNEERIEEINKEKANPIPFEASVNRAHIVGGINLEVGVITPEQINLIFKHLPFDVTYVDEFDEVRYYNKGEERVFPRSPGIIGRQVKHCHPPKSVHIVEKIVDAFKKGEKSEANFWINFQDKFVYIQYFAVRDELGNYKGVLEITYDAKAVRNLEGEQRLLDWE